MATGTQPGHGSAPNPWQGEIDTLKLEITDLRATLGSLVGKIEELERVKTEAVELHIPSPKVKSEPVEAASGADLGEPPAPAEPESTLGRGQTEVTREDQERMEVEAQLEDTSQGAGGAGDHLMGVPPQRRQTTEEPSWTSPPPGETFFRVNPERAQRIARVNGVVSTSVQAPVPPPQPREESPPHRSPLPASVGCPKKPVDAVPAPRAKRKHTFELIIETRKRSKLSNHSTQSSSPINSVASSSRVKLDAPSSTPAKPTLAKSLPRRLLRNAAPRKVYGTPLVMSLDPKIRDVTVTREFMCSYFGTHVGFVFSEPPQDHFDRHGYDHFVFVNGDSTTRAPFAPGEPGIITQFEGRAWPVRSQYRVFGRVGSARWQYMGLYKATKLPAWTPAEVKNLRVAVKCYWALTIRISKWARPALARIALRKRLGHEPTKNEVKDEIKRIDDKTVPPPSENTIITAFENGEEKAYPWKLECEDYEENLQWEIAITFPRHEKDKERKRSNASTNY